MNVTLRIACATALFLASSLAFACDYPSRPHIPNGETASKDDLIAAKDGVQNFIAAVDEYLRCIEEEETAAADELTDPTDEERQRRNDLLNQKFDAANEEKALVGEQFNQQIRVYNTKRKQSKD